MRSALAAVLLPLFLLAACSADVVEDEGATDAGVELNALFERHFEELLELNPVYSTFLGERRYNHLFANSIGPEHRAAEAEMARRYLAEIRAIDPASLGEQDRLSYEMFVSDLEREIESERFPTHLLPLNQFYSTPNFFVQLGSGTGAQPFETVEDYDAFLQRIDGFLAWMVQAEVNFKEGIEQGVVLPAYARLHDFLRDDYLPHARDTVGMNALPDGEAWYAFNVENITTTDLTPAEIHEIGLAEVSRIHNEIRAVMERVGFEGTLHEFFVFTERDPQFFYATGEELIQGYRDLQAVVDPLLPKLFDLMPEANYEVRAVEPFREQSAAGGSYMRPAPDGSRPGIFYANTYDINARPKWAMESLSLHEASPGHHFQLSIQQELEGLPRFRRFGGYTAYTEGWGLYAETLGKELGVYTDPYQYYGALSAELWRAIRLVVDTGLHHHGWTREQVLEYMGKNSATAPARAIAEAERYIAIPGQALAYKIGQLKITALRDRAEAALGDRFDVRAFHTEVLEGGALPLDVLETKIDRWIEEVKAS